MKIKLTIFCFFNFFVLLTAFSQQYRFIYYMDAKLSLCDKSVSVVTGKGNLENGHLILDCFDNETQKLLLAASFKDTALKTLDGFFRIYFSDMKIQIDGNYANGEMEGLWQNWNAEGLKTDSIIYDKGVKVVYGKYDYFADGNIHSYSITDSLNNTFIEKYFSFSKKGEINFEVKFVGQRGILTTYDSTGVKIDSVFNRELTEALFSGGDRAWRSYLETNLNTEVPGNRGAPSGTYSVVIKFMITREGVIEDIQAENPPGYGIAEEVIRVIKKVPKWIPAKQYGRNVDAYRRQPVTFSVDNGR